jgi:hypothetical protein
MQYVDVRQLGKIMAEKRKKDKHIVDQQQVKGKGEEKLSDLVLVEGAGR